MTDTPNLRYTVNYLYSCKNMSEDDFKRELQIALENAAAINSEKTPEAIREYEKRWYEEGVKKDKKIKSLEDNHKKLLDGYDLADYRISKMMDLVPRLENTLESFIKLGNSSELLDELKKWKENN